MSVVCCSGLGGGGGRRVVHALTQVLTLWTVVGGCTYTQTRNRHIRDILERQAGRIIVRVWPHDVALPHTHPLKFVKFVDRAYWLNLTASSSICVWCVGSLFQGGCGSGDHLHLGLRPLVRTPHTLHQYHTHHTSIIINVHLMHIYIAIGTRVSWPVADPVLPLLCVSMVLWLWL